MIRGCGYIIVRAVVGLVVWAIAGAIFQAISFGEVFLLGVVAWSGIGTVMGIMGTLYGRKIGAWAIGGAIFGAGGETAATGTVGATGLIVGVIAGSVTGLLVRAITGTEGKAIRDG